MAWIEPRTNWKVGDFFNIQDYNRIKNNLSFLHEYALTLFTPFEIEDMGKDKTYSDLFYANEMNVFENNLETINTHTYNLPIGQKTTYRPLGYVPTADEFLRIEKSILKIYETMVVHEQNLTRLSFILGNMKGVKV